MDNKNCIYPSLQGKNCILTGSNRGIGKALLSALAKNKVNIWACARKPADDFINYTKTLEEQYDVWIKPVYFELSDENAIKSALKEVFSEKKNIDLLINNAGILHHGLFTMAPISEIRAVFNVNVMAPIILMQSVIRKMQRQKSGNIVNLCSIAGLDSHPGDSIYGSSKAALASITKVAATESAPYGIRINAVAPGPVNTDMITDGFSSFGDDVFKNCAMQRLAAPEEITDAILYLLSDNSSFINGQIIRIDGGTN